MSAQGTGVGSVPGSDVRAAVRTYVVGALDAGAELVHLPELPQHGVHAELVGRAIGLLVGLAADLQPAGWRLTGGDITSAGGSLDQRRARSLLSQHLDVLEELTQGYRGRLKVQVAGPWTLAATVERPRGDRVLADAGARRELAQSLAAGTAEHVADVRRRVPAADVVVQVDEPALPAVLAAAVPTASGFGRHRSVSPADAATALGEVLTAVQSAGAVPVVHCCASGVPVRLLASAGARAVSLDVARLLSADLEPLATELENGLDLWPGLDLTGTPGAGVDDLLRLFDRLGLDPHETAGRTVVTPACGLAGVSEPAATRAYERARETARGLSGVEGRMSR